VCRLLICLLWLASVGIMGGCGAGSEPKTRLKPVNQKIATGQVQVPAGQAVDYRIDIQSDMLDPTLKGKFVASGGTGNDVTAVIADDVNYVNWINGHDAHVFWQTEGQQTAGNFELTLKPGTYHLAISNKFSTISDKSVALEVDLSYQHKEQVEP
jgi:hypothetical protein